MGKIYKNQTLLTISMTAVNPETSATVDLTGYDYVYINARNPDESTTQTWTCTVIDASTGTFSFANFTTTTLPTSGTYRLQPEISISGKIAPAETILLRVYGLYE